MEDELEHVVIAARRNGLKEITVDELTPIVKSQRNPVLLRLSKHLRDLKQDTFDLRVDPENLCEESAASATNAHRRWIAEKSYFAATMLVSPLTAITPS